MMDQPSPKNPDPKALVAMQAGTSRRRRPLIVTVLFLAIPLGLIGVLAWCLWPRPDPPPLELAALDDLELVGDSGVLVAYVQVVEPDGRCKDVEGQEVFIIESAANAQTKRTTDRYGHAYGRGDFQTDQASIHFQVRIPSERGRRRLEARGRVFLWPADSSVLLVDVDHTLPEVGPEEFLTANNLQIKPRSGAAAALRQVSAKYRIVYLTTGANRPGLYNKVRAWLEHAWAPQDRFPDGPVLCRRWRFIEQEGTPPIAERLIWLGISAFTTHRFRRDIVAIVGQRRSAEGFLKGNEIDRLGPGERPRSVRAYLLGPETDAPEGGLAVKSWDELGKQLR